MDVSPIQRLAMTANHAPRPVARTREAPAVAPTPQAAPASADQESTAPRTETQPRTRVQVSWHAASLGYITRVVDQHTGDVVFESPPEQVLAMVQKVIATLEGRTG